MPQATLLGDHFAHENSRSKAAVSPTINHGYLRLWFFNAMENPPATIGLAVKPHDPEGPWAMAFHSHYATNHQMVTRAIRCYKHDDTDGKSPAFWVKSPDGKAYIAYNIHHKPPAFDLAIRQLHSRSPACGRAHGAGLAGHALVDIFKRDS